jgi:hypothetical protein
MKIKNKQKVEVYMNEENKMKLQSRADKEDCSMAEVVKRALTFYYKNND